MSSEIESKPNGEPPSRKKYASPELVIYGNISQITQTVGMGKVADAAMGGADKLS
mgnify:CR=1 FL=1